MNLVLPSILKLFDTSDFPARWHCGNWSWLLGWSHIISDIIVFGAYIAIPILMVFFARKRPDIPIRGVFILFALFIICCGFVHLIEAIIFWSPIYRISAIVKVLTAGVSVATVVALVPAIPKLLAMKSPKQLEGIVEERTHALNLKNDELSHFSFGIAHDLKSPLRAIQNVSEWIEEDLDGALLSSDMEENLGLLKSRTARMEALLDGLLEYACVGGQVYRIEQIDLIAVMNNIRELLAIPSNMTISWPDRGIALRAPLPPLQQVFLNLISNAVKHHDKDEGAITVSWEDRDDHIYVSVADDGPGISERMKEKFFDIFVTGKSRDEKEGAGIGLSIVKKVIETHGGTVGLESTIGEGATFYFTWPKLAV